MDALKVFVVQVDTGEDERASNTAGSDDLSQAFLVTKCEAKRPFVLTQECKPGALPRSATYGQLPTLVYGFRQFDTA